MRKDVRTRWVIGSVVIAVCLYYAPIFGPFGHIPVVSNVNRIQIEGFDVMPDSDTNGVAFHDQITDPETIRQIVAIVNRHRYGWSQRIGSLISDSGLHPDASITLWSPRGRVMEFGIFQHEWQSDGGTEFNFYTRPGSAREMESFLDLIGFNGKSFYRDCYSRPHW